MQLWAAISNPEAEARDLNTFLAIAFAELKKYAFYYWFAFPAFVAKPAWQLESPWVKLSKAYSHLDNVGPLVYRHDEWMADDRPARRPLRRFEAAKSE